MPSLPDPFSRLTGFQWDAGNADKSWHTHQVTTAEAEQPFLNRPIVLTLAPYRGETEPRFALLGVTNGGRELFVIFTVRGDLVRVVSARPMSRRERTIYAQAIPSQAEGRPEVPE